MKRIFKQIFLLISLTIILTLPFFVFANPAIKGLEDIQKDSGFADGTTEKTLAEMAGTMISAFLSLLGIIFIALIIYGGYNWMYAGGDTGKLDTAKNTIKRAIIGLIIIISAGAFWKFIIERILLKN